jgi:hypothetical protein
MVCAVLGAAGGVVMGQPSAQERLAQAARLECRFGAVATGTWGDDDATASVAVTPSELMATFSNIDLQRGTAEAEGRLGASYIVVRYVQGYLHLMQMIDIGPLYVTTVIAQETTDSRLLAVHMRHEFAASSYPEFRERPKMYVGDCAVEH